MYRLEVKGRFVRTGALGPLVNIYTKERDHSCEGGSTWPDGLLYDKKDKLIARISYNGRLWEPVAWDMGPKEYAIKNNKLVEERKAY